MLADHACILSISIITKKHSIFSRAHVIKFYRMSTNFIPLNFTYFPISPQLLSKHCPRSDSLKAAVEQDLEDERNKLCGKRATLEALITADKV